MAFVLISHTRGDELIASTQKVVAVSEDRGKLEQIQGDRIAEREAWLAANPWLPEWAECSVIATEVIEEVVAL